MASYTVNTNLTGPTELAISGAVLVFNNGAEDVWWTRAPAPADPTAAGVPLPAGTGHEFAGVGVLPVRLAAAATDGQDVRVERVS